VVLFIGQRHVVFGWHTADHLLVTASNSRRTEQKGILDKARHGAELIIIRSFCFGKGEKNELK
jgi:hypothetical protein